jgi:hypothetical protein
MKISMNTWIKLFINTVIILGLLAGCRPLVGTPPQREFSTIDLLLYPGLLPNGWVITAEPTTEIRSDAMGLRNTLSGSEIEIQTSNSSIAHMVVVFPSAWDAAISYKDHDYTRNTHGLYPTTWEPLPGFEYKSPRANQFRVVCAKVENVEKVGEMCVIEAQYDEFLSILIYHTTNAGQAVDGLSILAKAVNSQMVKYLDK